MRIAIAGSEVANNIQSFANALSSTYVVSTYCFRENVFYRNVDYNYSSSNWLLRSNFKAIRGLGRIISQFKKIYLFLQSLPETDVYLFIWSETFIAFSIDLFILRALNKKILIFHCGDDVRYRPIQYFIDHYVANTLYFDRDDFDKIDSYLAHGRTFVGALFSQWVAEKTAKVISLRSHATFQRIPHYFFRFPQEELIDQPRKPAQRPLIIHAPSNRNAKNSQVVIAAIKILEDLGFSFNFELIEGKPNSYVLERLKAADILIDQPGPWVGRLAVEALAASCAVVGGAQPSYYDIDDNIPVLQFQPDANRLAEQLADLVDNVERRSIIMSNSYDYWKSNYSEASFSSYIGDIIAGTAKSYPPRTSHRHYVVLFAGGVLKKTVLKRYFR